jgi:hypothetical protein
MHGLAAGVGALSLVALADEDFRRQMQRGLAGFVRAVALEAVSLGATVAAGAEVALAGEASASHTAGVKQALRQVSTGSTRLECSCLHCAVEFDVTATR